MKSDNSALNQERLLNALFQLKLALVEALKASFVLGISIILSLWIPYFTEVY